MPREKEEDEVKARPRKGRHGESGGELDQSKELLVKANAEKAYIL